MATKIPDLMTETLIDVTDQIIPEENPKFFNDEESFELYQTCIHLMDEFIKDNPKIISEPDFDDIFDDNIKELMQSHFDYDVFYNEEAEEEMDEIIEQAKSDFFRHNMPPRSYPDTIILNPPNKSYIKQQLDILRNKPQPTQRTKEWYEFRHNLITASNAYKAFENQSTKNQLIYEKCQPLNTSLYEGNEDIKEIVMVNTHSTLHWGQKYEPLSVLIYEFTYNTKVEDFGCIQHDTYLFVGASPDGINVDPSSSRYGRMLEIKNIVNREIDGIPKKEYWIQMQMQMEVCELDECDFLETKFIEYPDRHAFNADCNELDHEDDEGNEFTNVCLSKDDKMKGEIIYFHGKEGKPVYKYKPLDYIHPSDIDKWEEDTINCYQSEPYNYTFMKIIYWKLECMSCVLVVRNKQWFQNNIQELEELWNIIEKERVSGYEHRAPNRRPRTFSEGNVNTNAGTTGCLLKFNKESGKITVVKIDEV